MPPEDMTNRRHAERLKEDCDAIQKRCDRAERALAAKTALCEGLARKAERLRVELRELRERWEMWMFLRPIVYPILMRTTLSPMHRGAITILDREPGGET